MYISFTYDVQMLMMMYKPIPICVWVFLRRYSVHLVRRFFVFVFVCLFCLFCLFWWNLLARRKHYFVVVVVVVAADIVLLLMLLLSRMLRFFSVRRLICDINKILQVMMTFGVTFCPKLHRQRNSSMKRRDGKHGNKQLVWRSSWQAIPHRDSWRTVPRGSRLRPWSINNPQPLFGDDIRRRGIGGGCSFGRRRRPCWRIFCLSPKRGFVCLGRFQLIFNCFFCLFCLVFFDKCLFVCFLTNATD